MFVDKMLPVRDIVFRAERSALTARPPWLLKTPLPYMGQIKQSEIEHQMKSATSAITGKLRGAAIDLGLEAGSMVSPEVKTINNMRKLAKNFKNTLMSWYEMIKEWVVSAYSTVKDAFAQAALAITTGVQAILNSCKESSIHIMDLLSGMAMSGINLCSEWFSKVKLWFVEKAKEIKRKFTRADEEEVLGDYNTLFPLYEAAVDRYMTSPSSSKWEELRQLHKLLSKNPEFAAAYPVPDVQHQGLIEDCAGPLLSMLVMSILTVCEMCGGVPQGVPSRFYSTVSCLNVLGKVDFTKLGSFANVVYHAITGNDFTINLQMTREFTESTTKLADLLAQLDNCKNPTIELQHAITEQHQRMELCYPALLAYDNDANKNRTALYNHLHKKAAPWLAGSKAGDTRMKPIAIVLFGGACCGKTTAQNNLVRDVPTQLAALFQTCDRSETSIFAAHGRMSSVHGVPCLGKKTEFEDGYRDQLFYAFEEYLTSKSAAIKAEWALHFMKCIDSQPYPLNMAFDKGNRYFNSPFVIATGNAKQHYTELEDADAYYRRIEFDLTVTRDGPGGFYKSTWFTPSAKMKEIYCSEKAPSAFVKLFLFKHRFEKFNYETLLYLVVGAYMDRLYNYHISTQESPLEAMDIITQSLQPRLAKIPDGTAAYVSGTLMGAYQNIVTNAPLLSPAAGAKVDANFIKVCENIEMGIGEAAVKLQDSVKETKEKTDQINRKIEKAFEDVGQKFKEAFTIKSDAARGKERDKGGDTDAQVEHQNGKQVYTPPPFAPGPRLAQLTYERAEGIFDSVDFFSELYSQKLFSGRCMSCDHAGLLQMIHWRQYDGIWHSAGYNPSLMEQFYPKNAWIHMHFVNMYSKSLSVTVSRLPEGKLPADKSLLSKSEWSNVKKVWYQVYFHWFMVAHCCEAHFATGRRSTADSLRNTWREALPFLTERELLDLRWSIRMEFDKDLSKDGRLLNVDSRLKKEYQDRLNSNAKRAARKKWEKQEAEKQLKEDLHRQDVEVEEAEPERIEQKSFQAPKPRVPYREQVRAERRNDRAKTRNVKQGRQDKIEHQMFKGFVHPIPRPGFFYYGESPYTNLSDWTRVCRFSSTEMLDPDVVLKDTPKPSFFTTTPYADQFNAGTFQTPVHRFASLLYFYYKSHYLLHREDQDLAERCCIYAVHLIGVGTDDKRALADVPHFYDMTVATTYAEALDSFHKIDTTRMSDADVKSVCAVFTNITHGFVLKEMQHKTYHGYHPIVAFFLARSHLQGRTPNPFFPDVSTALVDQVFLWKHAPLYITAFQRECLSHFLPKAFPMVALEDLEKLFKWDIPEAYLLPAIPLATALVLTPIIGYTLYLLIKQYRGTGDPELVQMEKIAMAGEELSILHQSVKTAVPKAPPLSRDPGIAASLKGIVQQMGSADPAAGKIGCNAYKVVAGGMTRATLTFVGGTVAFLNTHVWEALPPQFELVPFVKLTEVPRYMVTKVFCKVLEANKATDITMISFPMVRSHGAIKQHCATEEELFNLKGVSNSGLILTYNQHGEMDFQVVEEVRRFDEALQVKKEYVLPRYFHYKWKAARAGVCGSVLFLTIGGRMKAVGFHTAGKAGELGISTIIGYEKVFAFDHTNKTSSRSPKLDLLEPYEKIALADEGEAYQLQYNWDKKEAVFTTPIKTFATGITQFVPTDFVTFNFEGGPPKIPAVLDREAYDKALLKETRLDVVNCAPVANQLMELYKEEIVNYYYGDQALEPCRTLTISEALDGYGDLNNFDKQTSKGIRLRVLGLSKQKILNAEHPDRQIFDEYMESKEKEMREGRYEYQLNCDKQKDELRDHERVQQKKTRIFKITDFSDNVHMKRATGDLINQTHNYHWLTPPSCGVDPSAGEWRVIANYFGEDMVTASDVKGFETTVSGLMLPYFCALFKRVYSGWSYEYAVYVIMATLYALRFEGGKGRYLGWQNTSGNWLTTWINTHTNMCYFSLSVIAGAITRGLDPVATLRLLKIKLYSDDNLTSLVHDWWGPQWLSRSFMELFRVELTGTDKGEMSGRCHLSQCDFLSRGFRFENGQVYAPLAFDSLISQLYYVRVPKGMRGDARFMRQQLQQNLDNVIRELGEYPEAEARRIRDRLAAFVSERRLKLTVPPLPDDFALAKLQRQ